MRNRACELSNRSKFLADTKGGLSGAPLRDVDIDTIQAKDGAAALSLELVSLQLNGQPVAVTTRELSSKNNGRGTSTIARTGGGAALGAIIVGLPVVKPELASVRPAVEH